jgi:Recombination endonuclease VII
MARLQKSMPAEAFAELLASDGVLKWCPACEQLLPVAEFQRSSRTWDGLYGRCRTCNATIAGAWYAERRQDEQWRERKNQRQVARRAAQDAEKLARDNKRYNLKQLYGLTLAQFEAMLVTQMHRCAICHRSFASSLDAHVDHDHSTGFVRGLLCTSCNNGLGRFRDDAAVLRRAADYLNAAAARAALALPEHH